MNLPLDVVKQRLQVLPKVLHQDHETVAVNPAPAAGVTDALMRINHRIYFSFGRLQMMRACSGNELLKGLGAILSPFAVALTLPVAMPSVLQVVHSPYKGISDCVVRMLREEGVGAFYKSYRTTVRAIGSTLKFHHQRRQMDFEQLLHGMPAQLAGPTSQAQE